ncbi:hypothetical protein EON81_11595 [bacterium]|nr:MAG: hypothetical protein EON81_11595 [bacterium]
MKVTISFLKKVITFRYWRLAHRERLRFDLASLPLSFLPGLLTLAPRGGTMENIDRMLGGWTFTWIMLGVSAIFIPYNYLMWKIRETSA